MKKMKKCYLKCLRILLHSSVKEFASHYMTWSAMNKKLSLTQNQFIFGDNFEPEIL